MQEDNNDRIKWLLEMLKEPMKEPGAALVYKESQQKIILIQTPCDDAVLDYASQDGRNQKAAELLEMLNTLVDGAIRGAAVGEGTLRGISTTLMRIRNLVNTRYTEFDLIDNHKRET